MELLTKLINIDYRVEQINYIQWPFKGEVERFTYLIVRYVNLW